MKLIVGLGNPGLDYAETRHNFGFRVLDHYADQLGVQWHQRAKFSALVAEAGSGESKVILAKPQTFYNLVGQSVQQISRFYQISLEDILVIHDEMALPLGTIRTRVGGSDAGNNGVKHIIGAVGAEFARVRIGSGLPTGANGDSQPRQDRRGYVLGRLSSEEAKLFDAELETVSQIISEFISGKFNQTTYRQ